MLLHPSSAASTSTWNMRCACAAPFHHHSDNNDDLDMSLPPSPVYSLPSMAQLDHELSRARPYRAKVRPPSPPTAPPTPSPTSTSEFWFEPSANPSASFLAEKTCEMICYLWFSSSLPKKTRRRPHDNKTSLASTALQFSASVEFVAFMCRLLEMTQVSNSVVILALQYIYRLKTHNANCHDNARPGSEFRVAVVSLMLANKFVDDNTYTNKTWSEVANIDLGEINTMEREFLQGLDYRLLVNQSTYESWLALLKGLVQSKQEEASQWQQVAVSYASSFAYNVPNGRARSVSPPPLHKLHPDTSYPFTFAVPRSSQGITPRIVRDYDMSSPRPTSSKRAAVDAFSPQLESERPSKRPLSLYLDMRGVTDNGRMLGGPASAGPSVACPPHTSDTLAAFSTLSLNSSRPSTADGSSPLREFPLQQQQTMHTLAEAYHLNHLKLRSQPQNLYYYSLAGSPSELEENDVPPDYAQVRKAKLRYQPAPSTQAHQSMRNTEHVYLPPPPRPTVARSARTSPVRTLPPLSSLEWSRRFHPQPASTSRHSNSTSLHNHSYVLPPPPHVAQLQPPLPSSLGPSRTLPHSGRQATQATFANAGSPSVNSSWLTRRVGA